MKNKKNETLLFVHQQSHIGGGQTYVNGLINAAKNQGYEVELSENHTLFRFMQYIVNPKYSKVIWSVYSDFPFIVYFLAWMFGKKNYFILYGVWFYEVENQKIEIDFSTIRKQFRQLRYKYSALFNQYLFCFFSYKVLHLSEYAKSLFYSVPYYFLLKKIPQEIIYGGSDIFYEPISKSVKKDIQKKLQISEDSFILLMVGRIEERKNYLDALRVLQEIKKKHKDKNIQLIFVFSHGMMNDYEYLSRIGDQIRQFNLGDCIQFRFGLSRETMKQFFQISDCYLMLSNNLETFGLVTLESLVSRVPVFGYNACPTPEVVGRKNLHFLSKLGDYSSVAKKIDQAVIKNKKKNDYDFIFSSTTYTWDSSFKLLIA